MKEWASGGIRCSVLSRWMVSTAFGFEASVSWFILDVLSVVFLGRVASKGNDQWVKGHIKSLSIEGGSGIVVVDPLDVTGDYTCVQDKTSMTITTSDISMRLSFNVISLVLRFHQDAVSTFRFRDADPVLPCTHFDRIWVTNTGLGWSFLSKFSNWKRCMECFLLNIHRMTSHWPSADFCDMQQVVLGVLSNQFYSWINVPGLRPSIISMWHKNVWVCLQEAAPLSKLLSGGQEHHLDMLSWVTVQLQGRLHHWNYPVAAWESWSSYFLYYCGLICDASAWDNLFLSLFYTFLSLDFFLWPYVSDCVSVCLK